MVSNEKRTGTSDTTSDTKYTNLTADILRDTVFTKKQKFQPRSPYPTPVIDFVTSRSTEYGTSQSERAISRARSNWFEWLADIFASHGAFPRNSLDRFLAINRQALPKTCKSDRLPTHLGQVLIVFRPSERSVREIHSAYSSSSLPSTPFPPDCR